MSSAPLFGLYTAASHAGHALEQELKANVPQLHPYLGIHSALLLSNTQFLSFPAPGGWSLWCLWLPALGLRNFVIAAWACTLQVRSPRSARVQSSRCFTSCAQPSLGVFVQVFRTRAGLRLPVFLACVELAFGQKDTIRCHCSFPTRAFLWAASNPFGCFKCSFPMQSLPQLSLCFLRGSSSARSCLDPDPWAWAAREAD